MKYGAVLICQYDSGSIPRIIEDHLKFLPSDFGFIGFGSEENRYLYKGYDFKLCPVHDLRSYNLYRTSLELWDQIPFDKVLMFECDSGLLRKGIEEFYEWDYVGAPWPPNSWMPHDGGNGGLSWRSVKAMRELARREDDTWYDNDDLYYVNKLQESSYRLAPRSVCSRFSMEGVFQLGTLGYHKIWPYYTWEVQQQILNQYKQSDNPSVWTIML